VLSHSYTKSVSSLTPCATNKYINAHGNTSRCLFETCASKITRILIREITEYIFSLTWIMDPITLAVLSNHFQFFKRLHFRTSYPKGYSIGKLYLSLNYKFLASKSRINTYVKRHVKNYEVRVSKQSVNRSKNGVRPMVYINLR